MTPVYYETRYNTFIETRLITAIARLHYRTKLYGKETEMAFTQTENQPKRRDQLVIMAEIIQIAKNGTSKTHVMFKANLSFSQLNLYLQTLTQTGLLEKSKCEGKEIYKATQQGLDFMEKQCQIISLFNVDLRKNNIKTSFAFNPFSRGKLII